MKTNFEKATRNDLKLNKHLGMTLNEMYWTSYITTLYTGQSNIYKELLKK